ncbi:MAG: HAD-IA family hydrolase [Pseudomonadota bacterium]
MAIEHVIFDCDGVLIDSEWLACRAEAEVFSELGADVTPEHVLEHYVGLNDAAMYALFEEQFGIGLPDDFVERHTRRLYALFEAELEPVAGVEEVLAGLPAKKSVASNSGIARLQVTLGQTGLLSHFNGHVYSAEHVARPKPAPDLLEHVLRQTGASPRNSVLIEDGASGTLAARELDIPVLGFVGGRHCTPKTADKLKDAGALRIFEQMTQLPVLLEELG